MCAIIDSKVTYEYANCMNSVQSSKNKKITFLKKVTKSGQLEKLGVM